MYPATVLKLLLNSRISPELPSRITTPKVQLGLILRFSPPNDLSLIGAGETLFQVEILYPTIP